MSQVLNDELEHGLDLNGDGNIGNTVNELLHDDGSLAIYRIVTGEHIIADSGSSIGDIVEPTFLKKGTTNFTFKNKISGSFIYEDNTLSLFEVSTNNRWIKHDFNKLDGQFIKSKTYSLSEIFDEELLTNQDLNNDRAIGNGIVSIIADDGLNFGLYLDASNSYFISDSNLDIGDKPLNSFTFTSERVYRGNTISSPYNFKFNPIGAALNEDDEILVYYKDSKDNWFRDTFSNTGVFKNKVEYSLTDLLVDELTYLTDLNADGEIGDIIKSVFGTHDSNSLYKSASNAYLLDNSNLNLGDLTNDPTVLVTQKVLRGKTTTSLHKFSSDPSGVLYFKDGSGVGVYYQDTAVKQHGNAIALIMMVSLSNGFVNHQ